MNKIYKWLEILFFGVSSMFCILSAWKSTNEYKVYTVFYLVIGLMFLFLLIKLIVDKDYERIKVVYHTNDIIKIKRIPQGNWIDLRAAETVELKAGESGLISLGISMKLPVGYEAHIVPRSSTYKCFKIIQTNGIGVIDNSYSGTNDIWKIHVRALDNTTIYKNDRICQFRIVRTQPEVHFIETDKLDDVNRGGFGSTGKQ